MNCTLTGNSAPEGGALSIGLARPILFNCILWGDQATEIVDPYDLALVSWSNVQGGWSGEGNLDTDPLFADPMGGDYRLTVGSSCIDSGSNEAAVGIFTDLDGDLRIWDGDNVPGAVVDMGAYEFGSVPYVPGDTDGDGVVGANDLFYFSLWWRAPENAANGLCDCVDDGMITEADLLRLIPHWR